MVSYGVMVTECFSNLIFEYENFVPSFSVDSRSIEKASVSITIIKPADSRPYFPIIIFTLKENVVL